jgi:outer membrane protein OmpA-like peptidoglycan-associated protein
MFNVKVLPVLGFAAISFVAGCGTSETAFINSNNAPVDMVSMASPLSSKFQTELVTVVYFEFGSDELDATALRLIEDQAVYIMNHPNTRFYVSGHTDRVGSNSYNFDLGMRRAVRVVAALVAMGVNEQQLVAKVSKGEEETVVATQEPELANRRVVIEVMGLMPASSSASLIRNDDDNNNRDRRRSTPINEATEDEAPEVEAPEDEAPEDEAPEDEAPEDEAPEDEAPEDEAPEDEAPEDEAPEDEAPEDEAPEDEAPEDEAPEDEAPEDEAPEDEAPDSDKKDKKVKGNNGWGNGDQDAPGGSGDTNNAENG